ncbi:MAG: hypothetical protein ABSA44_05270 [Bacteroidota bacterium]
MTIQVSCSAEDILPVDRDETRNPYLTKTKNFSIIGMRRLPDGAR